MSKVFIIETPHIKLDAGTISVHGEPITVYDKDARRPSVFNTGAFCEDLIERMDMLGFDNSADYICVVGSMVTLTVAIAAIVQRWHSINLLLFRANDSAYVKRTIGDSTNGNCG